MYTELERTYESGRFSLPLNEVWSILQKHRIAIGVCTVGGFVAGLLITFALPKNYQATAIILPPQHSQSLLTSVVGQVNGIMPGGMTDLGLKNPADLYIGILSSRSIADAIIEEFKLQDRYKKSTLVDTRKALEKHRFIEAGNDTLIHITVEDRDPEVAASIANRFVDELSTKNNGLAFTESAQRRAFFEQQLQDERTALAKAEESLAKMQRSTGVIKLEGQVEASIQTIAQLRAQIAARQVALKRLETATTAEHPEYQRLQTEIKELEGQVQQLQTARPTNIGDPLVPTANLPSAGLEYLRAVRDLKYHESLYEFLTKQHEAAKIDEAKQAPVIQVVDRAAAPDKASWPVPSLFMLAGGLIAFVGACGRYLYPFAATSFRSMF